MKKPTKKELIEIVRSYFRACTNAGVKVSVQDRAKEILRIYKEGKNG